MAENEASEDRRSPGWYADESMADTRRYWDGLHWTEHVVPAQESDAHQGPPGSDHVANGVLKAICQLALIGVACGIALFSLPLLADQGAGVLVGGALLVLALAIAVYAIRSNSEPRPWAWWELGIVAVLGAMLLAGLIATERDRQREDRIDDMIRESCLSTDLC
jgi:VIT1/CCC1 family predicted Fe2+/Mn2+ transporter